MTTEELSDDSAGVARAAALLGAGGLVAFPTETVYGLGANARDDRAVARIFEAKGRPSFNPLIAHVAKLAEAEQIGHLPEAARPYLLRGWPAGLTLVVPLRAGSGISPLVTAGQKTIALRVPASPIAQGLLAEFAGAIAAPSANPSGRISPTSAAHVRAGLGGKIEAIVDGGTTRSGLESTILTFDEAGPIVLREGAYQVPDTLRRRTDLGQDAAPAAPGMLTSHYAPQGQLRMNVTDPSPDDWYISFGPQSAGHANLSPTGDLVEAAAKLFALLHAADSKPRIAVAPIPDTGLGRAINDRLRRAAAPRS